MTDWPNGDFPWKRSFHPRRGGFEGPRPTLDPKAAEKAEKLLNGRIGLFAETGDSPDSVALRNYLAGEADPVGAAIAFHLAARWEERGLAVFADAHVRAHGLPFAAEAVARTAGGFVNVVHDQGSAEGRWRPANMIGHDGWNAASLLIRTRALLAAADEATYRAAVERLAPLRADGRWPRLVLAFLVPTETAWVDDVLGELSDRWAPHAWLVRSALSTSHHAAELARRYPLSDRGCLDTATLATLADGCGVRLVPFLVSTLAGADLLADERRTMIEIMSRLPSDEAFGFLLNRRDGHRQYMAGLTEAMRLQPERAVRLLGEALNEGPKVRDLLRGHLAAHPELLDGELPPHVRELAVASKRVAEAPLEDLPPVLVAPPWTRRRPAAKTLTLHLAVPEATSMRWRPGEREEWRAREYWTDPHENSLTADLGLVAAESHQSGRLMRMLAEGPEEKALGFLGRWDPSGMWDAPQKAAPVVARFEAAVLPQMLTLARENPAVNGGLLLPFHQVEVARLMADWFGRLKSARHHARAWFDRHGADLLIPDALGAPGKARSAAVTALRLASAAELRAAAVFYGAEAESLVTELLAADPLESLPRRMPAVGPWADPRLLPQIRLRTGAALPASAAGHVLSMLAISVPGNVYAGLEIVKETCDGDSLEEFGWAVFSAWRQAGQPAKDAWALTSLGIIGGDATVRRLTPVIRAWPGEGGVRRALDGLDVLAEIGTDVALMHLHGIGRRLKYQSVKDRAQQKMDELARDLGLTSEQLADRLVPDLGLARDGSMVLDYGPRRFTVGFDEQLRPYVLDGDGHRRKDLPAPGVKDDPLLAPAAKKRFTGLKRDVRSIATAQTERLEKAMLTGRTWTVPEFTGLFAVHPVLFPLARRLVWLCEAGAFRLAEDGTLADADDDPFTPPQDALIRVAHPLHLAADLPRWRELFADYDLLQPCPQLDRPFVALDPGESARDRIVAFEQTEVPAAKLLTLRNRSWRSDGAHGYYGDGHVYHLTRVLPGEASVTMTFRPGIELGRQDLPDQTLTSISLDGPAPDPITASEVIADLTGLVTP